MSLTSFSTDVVRMVPNCQIGENSLAPPVLIALTLQKYIVASDNGPTLLDVAVTIESSLTTAAKDAVIDTCK